MLKTIKCPFCGDEPYIEFIYTNSEGDQIDCEECNRSYTYVITEFDWETWEDDYIGKVNAGNSKTSPPPRDLEEYKIPSYKCVIEHWTILKNCKRFMFMDWLSWFALLLPLPFRRSFFIATKNELF